MHIAHIGIGKSGRDLGSKASHIGKNAPAREPAAGGSSSLAIPSQSSMPPPFCACSTLSLMRRRRTPSPLRVPACTAAPYATALSGLTPQFGSFPVKKVLMSCSTNGMRVEPQTKTNSLARFFNRPESSSTCFTGPNELMHRSSILASSGRTRD